MNQVNNVSIVWYPPYAGGKFLIACLGLSSSGVLVDDFFARQDIDGNLSVDDKFHIVKNRLLGESKEKWADMQFIENFIFGIGDNVSKITASAADLSNSVVSLPSHKQFFVTAHHNYELKKFEQLFPLARTIQMVNYQSLITLRRGQAGLHSNSTVYAWNQLRRSHLTWAESPPIDLDDFKKLPEYSELKSLYPGVFQKILSAIETYHYTLNLRFGDIIWDCKNYFDKDNFVDSLEQLYQQLQFQDFATVQPYLQELYKLWADINLDPTKISSRVPIRGLC
jgi:hypothetical protein